MEYENAHQTRISSNYLLLIGKDPAGGWKIQINGPRPISGSLESINLPDAQVEAYSVAVDYFVKKGIIDLRIPREKIVWVPCP